MASVDLSLFFGRWARCDGALCSPPPAPTHLGYARWRARGRDRQRCCHRRQKVWRGGPPVSPGLAFGLAPSRSPRLGTAGLGVQRWPSGRVCEAAGGGDGPGLRRAPTRDEGRRGGSHGGRLRHRRHTGEGSELRRVLRGGCGLLRPGGLAACRQLPPDHPRGRPGGLRGGAHHGADPLREATRTCPASKRRLPSWLATSRGAPRWCWSRPPPILAPPPSW